MLVARGAGFEDDKWYGSSKSDWVRERLTACTIQRMTERSQSLGEEIANSVSHGIALLATIAALPFLIAAASRRGESALAGGIVFSATISLLYLTSTLYHATPAGRLKRLFLKLDHSAIFLFIAGSYTPFALGSVMSTWGWAVFGLVWSFAVIGVALKTFDFLSHPGLSTGLYLTMGWLVLIAAVPLVEHMPLSSLVWLVAGGLAYSTGVVFYLLDSQVRYAHAIWHGFVATGTGCHLLSVMEGFTH
jgi:hemolysin III